MGLILSRARGQGLVETNAVEALIPEYVRNKVFSRIVCKALDEGRCFSPPGLRHTWASLHMARGTPLKWIQEQGG